MPAVGQVAASGEAMLKGECAGGGSEHNGFTGIFGEGFTGVSNETPSECAAAWTDQPSSSHRRCEFSIVHATAGMGISA